MVRNEKDCFSRIRSQKRNDSHSYQILKGRQRTFKSALSAGRLIGATPMSKMSKKDKPEVKEEEADAEGSEEENPEVTVPKK